MLANCLGVPANKLIVETKQTSNTCASMTNIQNKMTESEGENCWQEYDLIPKLYKSLMMICVVYDFDFCSCFRWSFFLEVNYLVSSRGSSQYHRHQMKSSYLMQ